MRDKRGLGALLTPPAENWTWTIADEAVIQEKCEKLVRGLMPAYGINLADPNCWVQLAIKLADEYHPGFRVIDRKLRGRGRPPKDNARRTYLAIEEKVAQGMPIRTACVELAGGNRKKARSMETRYHEENARLRGKRQRRARGS